MFSESIKSRNNRIKRTNKQNRDRLIENKLIGVRRGVEVLSKEKKLNDRYNNVVISEGKGVAKGGGGYKGHKW